MRAITSVEFDRVAFSETYDRTGYVEIRFGRHCTVVGHCGELNDFAKRLLALSERLIQAQEESAKAAT